MATARTKKTDTDNTLTLVLPYVKDTKGSVVFGDPDSPIRSLYIAKDGMPDGDFSSATMQITFHA